MAIETVAIPDVRTTADPKLGLAPFQIAADIALPLILDDLSGSRDD